MRLVIPPETKPYENILPLINVVFLMLIFFLVAGTLKPFAELDVAPPKIAEGLTADNGRDVVMIDARGQIAFQGVLLTKNELSEKLKSFAGNAAEARLRVLADRTLPGHELVEILTIATKAGLSDVSLIVAKDR